MYTDPALLRDHPIKVRLNADEYAIVKAAADKAGMQFAEYCREAAMKSVRELIVLHGLSHS